MLLRETESYAPIPSTDTMVVLSLMSVAPQMTCVTHSQLAPVESANWNGAVAASPRALNCLAVVRATTLQMTSPTTMPLTPSSSFWSAVMRPILRASTTSWRASPRTVEGWVAHLVLEPPPREKSRCCSEQQCGVVVSDCIAGERALSRNA